MKSLIFQIAQHVPAVSENMVAWPRSRHSCGGSLDPRPQPLDPSSQMAPAPHSLKDFFLLERRERVLWKGRLQGYRGETTQSAWRGWLRARNLCESLFLFPSLNTTKEKNRNSPREPSWMDRQTGLALQPPPAHAANTARVSQSPDFDTWRGTHQLLVRAINPMQLKQQEQVGRAVPALRQSCPRLPPWPGAGGAGAAEPLPLRGPSARNPRHPGWGAEAFCSTAKKERISTWSCCFTARNSFPISSPSHVPEASQVFLQHIPPIPETIRGRFGRY